MKRIIKSAFIILAVLTVATGATISFFSDTETSSGNTFTAGEIDLQVDNIAHYNGCYCDGDEWKCEPWADAAISEDQGERKDNSDVLANRSDLGTALGAAESSGANSDNPVVTGSFYSLGFGGEVVIKFNNLVKNGDGDDLKIYEITGGTYPDEKAEVRVSQDGSDYILLGTANRDEAFDLDAVNLPWIKFVKIKDISDENLFTSDADGYDLDAVKALHCDCATQNLENQTCHNSWTSTDLGVAHKLFNFGDVKPADVGEDTLSLHVSENDAWGRMKVDVTQDSDGTCVDPEKDAESDCVANGENNGELRENLDFRVWLDEGITPGFQGKGNDIGEGDNIKQDGEILLINPGAINEEGETWSIKDAILASHGLHGINVGITADGHMVSGVTYYFGIGWELPEDTGNEAQTDIFEADISFEVEQYRNNPTPFGL